MKCPIKNTLCNGLFIWLVMTTNTCVNFGSSTTSDKELKGRFSNKSYPQVATEERVLKEDEEIKRVVEQTGDKKGRSLWTTRPGPDKRYESLRLQSSSVH